jgi:hypothetical protein
MIGHGLEWIVQPVTQAGPDFFDEDTKSLVCEESAGLLTE